MVTQTEFKNQIADGSRRLYGYIGNTEQTSEIFGAKRIYKTDVEDCIQRNDWVSGKVFDHYSNSTNSNSPKNFYTNVYQNGIHKVFKCLNNHGGKPSTTNPYPITRYEPITLDDGYMWLLMYQFMDNEYKKFQSYDVIPVYNDSIATLKSQPSTVQCIIVTNGGAGYSSAVVNIIGSNLKPARAIPIIKNGVIDRIDITDTGGGYDGAIVSIVGDGVGATAIIPDQPTGGHGSDAKAELFCNSVAISLDISTEEDYKSVPYGMAYNQFGLLQDIDLNNSKGDFRVKYIDVTNGGTNYTNVDKALVTITGGFEIGQTDIINAEAYTNITDEKIVSVIVNKKGLNYRSDPVVSITHPAGSGEAHNVLMESIMLKSIPMLALGEIVGTFIPGETIETVDGLNKGTYLLSNKNPNLIYYNIISGSFINGAVVQGVLSGTKGTISIDSTTIPDFSVTTENILITESCFKVTRQEDQPERLHFVLKF